MIREVKFESQDRRIKQIIAALNANGIKDIEPERRNTPLREAAVWSLPLWGRGGLHTHTETSASGDLLE